MWDNVSTGTPKLWCFMQTWPQKQLHTHPVILVPCLWALWRYKAERDHPAANALVWCSMKMIAVRTIIYDVYLARTGNCDIGTNHKFETVGLWDWSNMVPNEHGMVSMHGAIVKITENRVIVNVYLQKLCYILLMRHNSQVYIVCRFIVFVCGPNISDWDSETNCFTIIQLYYMLLWRLLKFTNKYQSY